MTRFDVVAMALAPERHIGVFVDHYRARGAERVRVYFDGPASAAPRPNVVGLSEDELTLCDDAFWGARGGRPAGCGLRPATGPAAHEIVTDIRVGISQAVDYPWRFLSRHSPHLSVKHGRVKVPQPKLTPPHHPRTGAAPPPHPPQG